MKPGIKDDNEKDRWDLLPWQEVQDVVKVLTYGAKHYTPDNWKYVEPARERYLSATMRHIVAWIDGEQADQNTNLPHLAHAVCCLLFLMWKDKDETNERQ